ncbi:aspartate/glutamate racemase family protein [Aquabacter cavernae]|uniref:aspartate/glutamate racemase family protein n=1 Tax=Aquabacter cavernae TaxID=2496029 RepID=UPI000F8E35BE|nr:aspartate/glutamate racemase family protein [Aquabacter cavernae]
MKILLLNGNTTESVTARMLSAVAKRCPQDVQLVGATAPFGAPYVSSRAAAAVAAHGALEAVRAAVAVEAAAGRAPFDACYYACFGEPGIEAIRAETGLPVAGMAEGAVLTALQLGERFAILTMGAAWPGMIRELLRRLALQERCAGIGVVEGDGLALSGDHEAGRPVVAAAARDLLARTPADVLIVAGAALAGYAGEIRGEVPVPALDSLAAGFEQTLALARLSAGSRASA